MTNKWGIAGLLFAAFGCFLVYREHDHLTTGVLVFAGLCVALGFYLMDSTDFKAFLSTIGTYLPWGKGRNA